MIRLDLGDGAVAWSLRKQDAPVVHRLMTESRDHLDQWLRWSSSIRSLADVEAFIGQFEEKEAGGNGFHLGVWHDGEFSGGVVCWYLHSENRNAEVGYWLGHRFTGRGLATRAARAVVDYLFESKHLHRIEMQCGVENAASRAVAERCGLTAEGVRRQSHWITDRFVDHVVYGILAPEWSAHRPTA